MFFCCVQKYLIVMLTCYVFLKHILFNTFFFTQFSYFSYTLCSTFCTFLFI